MGASIDVRSDFSSTDLRRIARRCNDPDQVRRLLALGLIVDGSSRSEAARMAGVTLQIIRDWVIRFNADGPDGLSTRKAPGKRSILNDDQRRPSGSAGRSRPYSGSARGCALAAY